ncbi:hypothetical protein BV741P4_00025 [Phocaeicola phage BV741P4]|nr:hypothetical protein BV741P4_00025 [Phocaeicola phage BV741P4]
MRDLAEIVKVKYGSYTLYQVNFINRNTGKYYNALSERFESKKLAKEHISKLGLELKKVKA